MHIAMIKHHESSVVPKQIHDHEVEAHAETHDVFAVLADGTVGDLVAGPSMRAAQADSAPEAKAVPVAKPAAKKTAKRR